MYSKESIDTFLKNQLQLLDEKVAETPEEAEEFLEDNLAVEVNSLKEVREYFEESGMDADGLSDEELKDASEVFELPSGKYLIVGSVKGTLCLEKNWLCRVSPTKPGLNIGCLPESADAPDRMHRKSILKSSFHVFHCKTRWEETPGELSVPRKWQQRLRHTGENGRNGRQTEQQ